MLKSNFHSSFFTPQLSIYMNDANDGLKVRFFLLFADKLSR